MISRASPRSAPGRDLPTPEDIVVGFLKSKPLTSENLKELRDPSSKLFRELHSDYMNRVVSRVVNPKGRHEHMAEKELMEILDRYLPVL